MLEWFIDPANIPTMLACATALIATIILALTIGLSLRKLRRRLVESQEHVGMQMQMLARAITSVEHSRDGNHEQSATRAQARSGRSSAVPTSVASTQPATSASPASAPLSQVAPSPAPASPTMHADLLGNQQVPAPQSAPIPPQVVAHNRFAALDDVPLNQ